MYKQYSSARHSPNCYNEGKNVKIYQICLFPNPRTGKFEIRSNMLVGENLITNTYYISEYAKNKLLEKIPVHRYKMYATYRLDKLNTLTCADIQMAQSELLNNSYAEQSPYLSFC